jgi:hypothetical protein
MAKPVRRSSKKKDLNLVLEVLTDLVLLLAKFSTKVPGSSIPIINLD